jgi:hypothetical protein
MRQRRATGCKRCLVTHDATVYLPLNDFGPLGRAYCETDEADANEAPFFVEQALF